MTLTGKNEIISNHNFFGVANLIQDNFEYLNELKTPKFLLLDVVWSS